jgi:hypothetical protein
MGGGDVSQLEYDIILELCHKYSRGTSKTGKGPRDILTRTGKTVGGGVTRVDIKNMLEDFKTDILSSLSSQLDTLQMKKKKEETKLSFGHIFPKMQNEKPMERMSIGSN